MSTPEDFEQRLAAGLEQAGGQVAGEGVTLAGVADRRRQRDRARHLRQGAGAALAAAVLAVVAVAVALGGGGDGATRLAAEGPSVAADPGAADEPTTTVVCGPASTRGPSTVPPSVGSAVEPTTTGPSTSVTGPVRPAVERVPAFGAEAGAGAEADGGSAIADAPPVDPCAPTAPTGPPSTPPPPSVPEGTTSGTDTTVPPETTTPGVPATTLPVWPAVVELHHGGSTWAVYLAVVPQAEGMEAPAMVEAKAQAGAVGYDPVGADLACDRGAADALGLDPAASHLGLALYFAVEADARLFVDRFGPEVAGVARVTNHCLD